jgi:hypothetical protein
VALEADPVAVLVPDGGKRPATLCLAGVERRIDVNQLECAVGQARQDLLAVAEHDVVGSPAEIDHVGPAGFEPALSRT